MNPIDSISSNKKMGFDQGANPSRRADSDSFGSPTTGSSRADIRVLLPKTYRVASVSSVALLGPGAAPLLTIVNFLDARQDS